MEAKAAIALDQLDAIEDATAHITRAAEGVGSVTRDQDRLLAGPQPLGERRIFGLAEQALADRGNTDQRRIEIDEWFVRRSGFGPGDRLCIPGACERLVDLAVCEQQTAHGPVGQERLPTLDLAQCAVDLSMEWCHSHGSSGGGADPARARDLDRRADAVALAAVAEHERTAAAALDYSADETPVKPPAHHLSEHDRIGLLRAGLVEAERIYDTYADAVDHAGTEPVLLAAQEGAGRAVHYLGLIAARLYAPAS